jgi:periplasmic protein TonB
MFTQLIESKPKKQKMAGGTLFSLLFHGALITAAVVVTAKAGIASDKTKQEKITFVEMKKEPPKPKEPPPPPPPPKEVFKAPPPKGFQVLRAPVEIPIKIPDIDLSKKVTEEADFSGKGVKGGIAAGVVGGTAKPSNEPYFEYQVEKPVQQIPGTPAPRYPDALRSSGVEGEVQAQFVVNEDGRVEAGSFKVLKATNELFASAVRAALPQMRFYPAEVGGKHVRQLVQQTFTFKLDR